MEVLAQRVVDRAFLDARTTGFPAVRAALLEVPVEAWVARAGVPLEDARRVALLTSVSSSYSVGLSKVFRARLTAFGGQIVADQKYSEGDKDFRAQLTAIKAARPDLIAATGNYTEAALICKQARELGLTIPLIGGDSW